MLDGFGGRSYVMRSMMVTCRSTRQDKSRHQVMEVEEGNRISKKHQKNNLGRGAGGRGIARIELAR